MNWKIHAWKWYVPCLNNLWNHAYRFLKSQMHSRWLESRCACGTSKHVTENNVLHLPNSESLLLLSVPESSEDHLASSELRDFKVIYITMLKSSISSFVMFIQSHNIRYKIIFHDFMILTHCCSSTYNNAISWIK